MKDSIKRILVPLDPSMHARGATITACRIAAKHQAQLAGVAVLDSKEIESSIVPAIGPYYPMMLDAVRKKKEHADKILHQCREQFVSICKEYDVIHYETEYEGIPAQKLLESAIFFDLVVMGLETSFHFETRGGKGDTIDKVLDRTCTPVLAVPACGMEDPKKVVIAFDGSFGAARALHDFAAVAAPYDLEITVVTADQEDRKKRDFLLNNVEVYLFTHGFLNIETISAREPIEEVLTDSLIEEADLIVAGIHSRKYFKDYFVGSFTKKLIERGDTALLLSH